MITDFYGYKLNQSQAFDDKGRRLVVTKIKTPPLTVQRLKTCKKDGYWAVQVAIRRQDEKKSKKSILREIKLNEAPTLKIGDELKIEEIFKVNDAVKVRGTTKGRGFMGVVKRWGFAGGPKTHGQSDRTRAPGSIGPGTDPGRVWKGKKMPGRMGNEGKTITGLKVFKIDPLESELWLTGVVPGTKRGLVQIWKAK